MPSYGSTDNGAGLNGSTADEETATLLSKSQRTSFRYRIREHLTVNIDQTYGDIPLFVGYIATGLLDSTAISIYNCFVSMQTGNTIYLGLGLVRPDASDRWIKSLISIGAFCTGSFVFSRLHHGAGEHKRWVLMLSYALQTTLLCISALIVTLGPHVNQDSPLTVWSVVTLSLIAAQSAGQAYTSRALKFNNLTSVVLTSNYCDLFADPNLFALQNPERNRRVIAPLMLLLGAFLGGVFAHSRFGLEGALWTGVGLKGIVAIAWAAFPKEKSDSGS